MQTMEKHPFTAESLFPAVRSLKIRAGVTLADNLAFSLELFKKYRPLFAHFGVTSHAGGPPVTVMENASLEAEEYILRAAPAGVGIEYRTPAGCFYALITLLQIVQRCRAASRPLPAFTVQDAPQLPLRAFMLDVSRGAVPQMAAMKTLLLRLALLKINTLSLYIEDTVFVDALQNVNIKKSMFSTDEIRQIVALARQYHIEVIPSLQSLCHLANLLKLPPFRSLALVGKPDCLDPRNPEAREFIQRFTAEIAGLFDSPYINIGMDECAALDSPEDYLQHFLEMVRFFRARGKQVMVWGDMFLKYPELIRKIPQEVTVLNWDYFSTTAEACARHTAPFRRHHLRQVLCPASWGWAKFVPSSKLAMENTAALFAVARSEKLAGMMFTSWGDDGNEYLPDAIALSLFHAGNLMWSGRELNPAAFSQWLTGRDDAEVFRVYSFLAQVDKPFKFTHRYFLYEDPLFAPYSAQEEAREIVARYEKAADYLRRKKGSGEKRIRYFGLAEKLYDFIAAKVKFSSWLQREEPDAAALAAAADDLIARLESLKALYADLWCREYQPEGLFDIQMKFAHIRERLEYAKLVWKSPALLARLRQRRARHNVEAAVTTVRFPELFEQ